MDSWKEAQARFNMNFDRMVLADKAAKALGQMNGKEELVGRYITEPIADGSAYYQIIKQAKARVRIRVVTGIGDDWQVPYWGEEASIDIAYARQNIYLRDETDKIFGKRNRVGEAVRV